MPTALVSVALVTALSAGLLSLLLLRRAGLLSILTALRLALGLEFLLALIHLSATRLHLFV